MNVNLGSTTYLLDLTYLQVLEHNASLIITAPLIPFLSIIISYPEMYGCLRMSDS